MNCFYFFHIIKYQSNKYISIAVEITGGSKNLYINKSLSIVVYQK